MSHRSFTSRISFISRLSSRPPSQYHQGFQEQVQKWPTNPNNLFIEYLKQHPKLVVGDFGCGEACIAQAVPNVVHSFDLVAANPRVTACNMKNVPLSDNKLDVAIFCLSLMGTDYIDFIKEARRVLKPGLVLDLA